MRRIPSFLSPVPLYDLKDLPCIVAQLQQKLDQLSIPVKEIKITEDGKVIVFTRSGVCGEVDVVVLNNMAACFHESCGSFKGKNSKER
ncbi:MAG: hypothetical protein N2558_01985 [Patescibacteria group bacterium]|nr:hypothetical protein [Patescibacteria group bacterium]